MNDRFGYDEMKDIFYKDKVKDIPFEDEMDGVLNERYQKEDSYNGYDEKINTLNNHESIAEKYDFNVINFDGEINVKKKTISKESKARKVAKTIAAILIATGVMGFGIVHFVDLINHPENYLTTDPNFEGRATISEVIKRTPENFGIGGK